MREHPTLWGNLMVLPPQTIHKTCNIGGISCAIESYHLSKPRISVVFPKIGECWSKNIFSDFLDVVRSPFHITRCPPRQPGEFNVKSADAHNILFFNIYLYYKYSLYHLIN